MIRATLTNNSLNGKLRCLVFVLFMVSFPSYGWDAHSLLTSMVIKKYSSVSQQVTVPAESLLNFLQQEKSGLEKLLRNFEFWSRDSIKAYKPLPQELFFQPNKALDLRTQFFHAIRINPNYPCLLFALYLPGEPHRIHHQALKRDQVMLKEAAESNWIFLPSPPIESVNEGELLSPYEILLSSVEEPDFGMDMNLFEDNPNSQIANLYHWGNQPFGNPEFTLGSQAAFHMGYFYEAAIINMLSSIARSNVEYRIHLYTTLAKFAFRSGHLYWGYRFLGWALHYVQDLTQPYHTTLAPNFGTTRLIVDNTLTFLWITSPLNNVIQLVSNRHFSLENYVLHLSLQTAWQPPKDNLIEHALEDYAHDKTYPPYSQSYPRDVIAKESHEMADELDELIRTSFPEKYVNDPDYQFFKRGEPPPDLYELVNKSQQNTAAFNQKIALLMKNLASHTRNFLGAIVPQH